MVIFDNIVHAGMLLSISLFLGTIWYCRTHDMVAESGHFFSTVIMVELVVIVVFIGADIGRWLAWV